MYYNTVFYWDLFYQMLHPPPSITIVFIDSNSPGLRLQSCTADPCKPGWNALRAHVTTSTPDSLPLRWEGWFLLTVWTAMVRLFLFLHIPLFWVQYSVKHLWPSILLWNSVFYPSLRPSLRPPQWRPKETKTPWKLPSRTRAGNSRVGGGWMQNYL